MPTANIDKLLDVMARLRHPNQGCPWDVEQTFETIVPYTIEEAYEVADAIDRGDMEALRDELGDLLLQVVFHARMAEEQDDFVFDDVAGAIAEKLIRRHPHVFGDGASDSPAAVKESWETLKAAERAGKAAQDGRSASVLDDVPAAFPALMRAEKLQKRAARVGFDWPDVAPVLEKVTEELDELKSEIAHGGTAARLSEEAGDLLFSCVNVLRHLKVDPEAALRSANAKFERRFRTVEAALAAEDRNPSDADIAELEELWQRAKKSD
ncbi:MAG: nucleoside triphosphate pyrophosphohydrolase [Alphaproteobacteria bacterium]|nr:nucleoside triphosphate pyrophosphohydrolase [Alphaproteobacteria bacterium]